MRNDKRNQEQNIFFCRTRPSEHIENRIDYKYTVKKVYFRRCYKHSALSNPIKIFYSISVKFGALSLKHDIFEHISKWNRIIFSYHIKLNRIQDNKLNIHFNGKSIANRLIWGEKRIFTENL